MTYNLLAIGDGGSANSDRRTKMQAQIENYWISPYGSGTVRCDGFMGLGDWHYSTPTISDKTDPSAIERNWANDAGTTGQYRAIQKRKVDAGILLAMAKGDNDTSSAVIAGFLAKFPGWTTLSNSSKVRRAAVVDPSDASNTLTLLNLDSTQQKSGPQTTWLNDELATINTRWVVIGWQGATYTASTSGGQNEIRTNWLPPIEAWAAAHPGSRVIVMWGDHHVYERFVMHNNVYYFTNGLGGGPIHGSNPLDDPPFPKIAARVDTNSFSGSREPYAFMHLAFTKNSCAGKLIEIGEGSTSAGNVLDSFTIAQASSGETTPTGLCLWGSHFSSRDGRGNQEETEFMEAKLERKVSMHRIFMQWQHAIPYPLGNWSWQGGRNIWVSWRALDNGVAVKYTSITNGSHDAKINAFRNWLTSLLDARPIGTIWFTFEHEPEDNIDNGTPAEFRAAFQYIYTKMKVDPRIQVLLIMSGSNYANTAKMADFHPGDSFVDGFGGDFYNWYPGRVNSSWREISVPMAGMFTFATAHGNKQCGVGEFGCQEDPAVPGRKGQWIKNAHDYFKTKSKLKAVCYFHSPTIYPWWLDTSTSAKDAMKTAGADPYFGGGPALTAGTAVTGVTIRPTVTGRGSSSVVQGTVTAAVKVRVVVVGKRAFRDPGKTFVWIRLSGGVRRAQVVMRGLSNRRVQVGPPPP